MPFSIKFMAFGTLLVLAGWPQRPGAQAGPTFEVVSIRPNTSQELGGRVAALPNGRFIMTNVPVSAIVITAFELQDAFQVDGLPVWSQTEPFDIEAQAPAGVPIAFPGQGLTGTFDVDLRYRPPDPPAGAGPPVPPSDPDLPPLETAVQEQLGLRLESNCEPADVLVIDRIERPTPN